MPQILINEDNYQQIFYVSWTLDANDQVIRIQGFIQERVKRGETWFNAGPYQVSASRNLSNAIPIDPETMSIDPENGIPALTYIQSMTLADLGLPTDNLYYAIGKKLEDFILVNRG